jgi:nitrite reductase (NADH) large subunit
VDAGYELYVAGNGGIKTEAGQFFCKAKDDAEVMQISGAFLQLYREQGWYLERTVHYVDRVGLAYVKTEVVDDLENRQALYERLLYSLQGIPDPWAELVNGPRRREFESLVVSEVA